MPVTAVTVAAGDEALEVMLAWFVVRMRHGVSREQLPKPAPGGKRQLDACTAVRQAAAASVQRANPLGSSASSLPRIARAKTGAAPSVEMPITSGERFTIAPKEKSQ